MLNSLNYQNHILNTLQYGRENVESALSLIEYDRYFDPVMKYVFGSTIICKDLEVAKGVSMMKYNIETVCIKWEIFFIS